MFAEFEDDIQFWGCNIPNEVKMVIDSANESVDKSFDNEDQKQAYHLGVDWRILLWNIKEVVGHVLI